MDHGQLLTLMVILLLSGILTGLPVSFILIGVPTLVALLGAALGSFDLAFLEAFPSRVFGLITNPIITSVPLFVLMGGLLEKSDIARRMMLTAGALFGKRRGGMAYAVVIVGALLAASTGVIAATIYMLGMVALPAMLEAKYSPRLAAGLICSAGSLGQIIPPSILLILLTDQISNAYQVGQRAAGNWSVEPVSVGDLFAGALLPGLVLVGLYLLYILAMSILRPETCPPVLLRDKDGEKLEMTTSHVLLTLVFPLLLIVLVMGSILGGVATPTESAALGAAGALVMAASQMNIPQWRLNLYLGVAVAGVVLILLKATGGIGLNHGAVRSALSLIALAILFSGLALAAWQELTTGSLFLVTKRTASIVSMMILIVIGATALALVFHGLGGDIMVADFLNGLPGGVPVALLTVMVLIFFLGFVIEYVEIIFIVVPVAGPPLMAAGVDPIWFAILISMNLQMSFLTPPFGYSLFYLRNVASDVLPMGEIYKAIIPFVCIQIIALGIVAYFPSLATWLPNLIYK